MKTIKLIFNLGLAIALLTITSCLCSSSHSPDDDPEIQKLTAYGVAEQYVLQFLKSPSSAKFPSSTDKVFHVKNIGNKVFMVDSWVESKNSFGVMIRNQFHIKVTISGEKARCSEFSITKN